jgi:FkbM family methyltransferase
MAGKNFYYYRTLHKLRKFIQPRVSIKLGHKTIIVPTDNVEESITLYHWQPTWKTEIIRKLLPLKVGDFIDIGANIGQTLFDFLAVQHQCQYIGFEPNLRCMNQLQKILHHNQLDNCTIVPIGLSNSNNILTLYLNYGLPIDSAATTIDNLRPGRNFETHFIPCYCFDDIRETLGIQAISLVKIDVEGAELAVLEGMRNSLIEFKPLVICEVLYADSQANLEDYSQHIKELMALLIDIKYSVFRICKVNDAGNVEKIARISSFPVKLWTEQNANECDYLFVPEDEIDKIAHSGIAYEIVSL